MSSFAVSGFIAIRMSISFLRARYPFLLARMVYQVGRPAMFDGNRFLPLTGTPMRKTLFSSTRFADCEPEPFTVAIWMLKSLTMRPGAFALPLGFELPHYRWLRSRCSGGSLRVFPFYK